MVYSFMLGRNGRINMNLKNRFIVSTVLIVFASRLHLHDFFLQKYISNHETINKPPSFRVIRALFASQSTFEIIYKCLLTTFYFLLSYGFFLYPILHKFCSVLTCDILGKGLL